MTVNHSSLPTIPDEINPWSIDFDALFYFHTSSAWGIIRRHTGSLAAKTRTAGLPSQPGLKIREQTKPEESTLAKGSAQFTANIINKYSITCHSKWRHNDMDK
jgi:hypothetical protein